MFFQHALNLPILFESQMVLAIYILKERNNKLVNTNTKFKY